MKNQLDINLTIFQLAEMFRELVPFVFESLGKNPDETTFETFNHIGRLRPGAATIGFYSFRNEEFFYWIFMKLTHHNNSDGAESLQQEFEVQIKKSDAPIFQIFGEKLDAGEEFSLADKLTELDRLEFECEEEFADFTENFTQKITEMSAKDLI
jgi:hypothetical protein